MMEDRYYESDIAKVKITFANRTKEEQNKVFKDIADACYNLVMYEYKKGVTKNENNNNSKGLANII
jgi:hypothetical protein